MAQKVYLKKSAVVDKTPATNAIEFGELAINYASGSGKSFLAHKKYDGTIAKYHEDTYFESQYATKDALEDVEGDAAAALNAAHSAFTYASAISATVKTNFATHTEVGNASAHSITSAVTSSKTYADSTFFTKESAGTAYDTLNTAASNALTAAQSAFTYASAISASVKNNFATHDEVKTASGNAITSAITSAKSYADSTFFTKASAGTAYDTLNTAASNALTAAQSAFTYASAISATVKNNFATHSEVQTASGNAITSAITSAKSYADSTFFTKESAGTAYDTLNTAASNARAAANSAFTYASAISATVKNNFATKSEVGSASANAITSAKSYADKTFLTIESATTAHEELATAASDAQQTANNAKTAAQSAFTYASAISATVKNLLSNVYVYKGSVATFADLPNSGKVAGYVYNVVAAQGNPGDANYVPAGTNYAWNGSAWDALGGSIDLSDFVTTGDLEPLEGSIAAAQNAANSAFTYASAISATVKNNFATHDEVKTASGNAISSAVTSAKSYADSTFFTKASAGTAYDTLNTAASNAQNAANSAFTYASAISATVKTNFATHTEVQNASGNAITSAITSAKSYADSTFFTKASAGTAYDTLNTAASNARAAANSAFTYASAISATVKNSFATKAEVGSASANAITSAITSAKSYVDSNFVKNSVYNDYTASTDQTLSEMESQLGNMALSSTVKTEITDIQDTIEENEYVTSAALNDLDTRLRELSGSMIGDFVTQDDFDDAVDSLEEGISNARTAANSAFTYASAISATVKNNFATHTEVGNASAHSITSAVTSAKSYADSTFFTKASAGTAYDTLNTAASNAQQAANSAFTYASAISATVKNNFATHDEVKTASGNAITSAITSAKSYADSTFFTKASAGTAYDTLNTAASNARAAANSAFTYASAISATVKNNFATHSEVQTASGNAITSAITSAKSYADSTFFTKASAGTAYDTLNTAASNARSAANSAFTYASAISATVKNSFATKAEVGDASAHSITSAITSAKSYADSTFVKNSVYGTFSSTTNESLANLDNKINSYSALSASVVNNYATDATASSYAAAALANAMDYTDSKISGLGSDYATNGEVQAASQAASNAHAAANSAFTYASAISATVKNNFATHSEVQTASGNAITSAITSAKSYADSTFFTKASAGTAYETLNTAASNARAAANSAFTYASAISATVKNNFATHSEVQTASGNAITSAITSAKSYADSTFFTKSSAGTAYDTLNTAASNARSAANSAFTYASAISATVKNNFATKSEVGSASANAITSAITSAKSYVDTNYATNTRVQNVEGDVATLKASAETLNNRFTSVYTYKGSVANFASLPNSGKVVGYVYNVVAANGNTPAGTNYAWNGTEWDALGGSIDLSNYATTGSMGTFSAGVVTRFTTNETDTANARAAANSAFTYASAISATVKSSFATKAEVTTASGNAISSAITSAKSYADSTFVKNSVYGSFSSTTNESLSNLSGKIGFIDGKYVSGVSITTTGTAASVDNHVIKIPVVNSNANLAFGESKTIATIGGVNVTASLPAGGYQGPQGPAGSNGNNATGKQGPQGPAGSNGNNATGKQGPQGPVGQDGYYIKQTAPLTGKSNDVWMTNSGVGKTVFQEFSSGHGLRVNDYFTLYGTDTAGNGHLNIVKVTATAATKVTGATVSTVSAHKGNDGSNGKQGPQGPKGETGGNGTNGKQGPQGPKGETGGNGTNGKQGPQGPAGSNGGNGANGKQGPQGPAGSNGNNATGKQGPQGPKGTDGTNGNQGPQGPAGAEVTPKTATTKSYLLGDTGTTTKLSSSSVKTHANIYMQSGSMYVGGQLYVTGNTNVYGDIYQDSAKGIYSNYIYRLGDNNYVPNGYIGNGSRAYSIIGAKEIDFFPRANDQWYMGFGAGNGNLGQFNVYHGTLGTLMHFDSAGTISLNDHKLRAVAAPEWSSDAANKGYVDSSLTGTYIISEEEFAMTMEGRTGDEVYFAPGAYPNARNLFVFKAYTAITDMDTVLYIDCRKLDYNATDSNGYIYFMDVNVNEEVAVTLPSGGGTSLSLTTGNTGNHYLIGCNSTSTGSVALTASNTHRAGAATGSGIYWTGWNLYASSDERLKTFYDDVEVDLDKIKSLPKKYFKWKDEEVDGSKMNIGTSAQKLRELYPELVSGGDDGTLGVCYEKLSVIALAAVDKLHEENEELKKKYEDLENRLKELEKLLLK